MNANYIVDRVTDDFILLVDIGPWTSFKTITNDAENVVKEICANYDMTNRRLFYVDSDGDYTELVIDRGRFHSFRPGSPPDPAA